MWMGDLSRTKNFRKGADPAKQCRVCAHFTGHDPDDPNDYSGKCWLQYDPSYEYGCDWISPDSTCDAFTDAKENT